MKRATIIGTGAGSRRHLLAAALSLLASGWAYAQSPAAGNPDVEHREPGSRLAGDPHSPPVNVVIFMIDTLRADRLGAYGYDRRPTSPRIDALAREAVVFEQACAPAPWTLPSIASLMTSTFPCEHQTLSRRDELDERFETLASRLKRLGYSTLGLNANPFAGPGFGLGRGYDELRYSAHNDGRKVAEVLSRHPETPFFLYIHNLEPHDPFDAPPHTDGFPDVSPEVRSRIKKHCRRYRRLTRVDFDAKVPPGRTDNGPLQERELAQLTELRDAYNELYDAAVCQSDQYVGSVIDLLERRGLWEDTLFILTSDHGQEIADHGGWLHEQSVYEELIRVPLIVRFPGGRYAGMRVRSVASLVDVLPTILDAVRNPNEARGARGRSLLPLVRGTEPDGTDDFTVPAMRLNLSEYYRPWKESRGDINVVIRHGRWKGIWNVEPKTFELYDLASDPGEQWEVSATNPDLALALRVFGQIWYQECGRGAAARPPGTDEPDEETLEKLRSLGYVD